MTEFLSVLISMIFGLGLTHVLAGTMRYVYAGRATEQRRRSGVTSSVC
jgi:hypothetical protein